MTSVLKRDYGNRARYLGSQNYERLHIYSTFSAMMADVSTATGRAAYCVATDTIYAGQGGTWVAIRSSDAGQFLTSVFDAAGSSVNSGAYTLALKFMPLSALACVGAQVYWAGAATTLNIALWNAGGSAIATGTIAVTSTPGIFSGSFGTPQLLTPGAVYYVSYSDTAGSPQYMEHVSSTLPVNAYSPPGIVLQATPYGTGSNVFPNTPGTTDFLVDPLFS